MGLFVLTAVCIGACGEDDSGTQAGNFAPSATATLIPTATPVPLSSEMLLQPGPAGVGVMTMTFVDGSRPTMASGTYEGAPTRTLDTEIWYPTVPNPAQPEQEQTNAPIAPTGPYPLIVYSHGFLGDRSGGAFIADHLATYGYVVIAPNFPLTNGANVAIATTADVVNQPGDVSFLINEMLALSADPANAFHGAIDPERIGATGLSLGGLTTYLIAFHPTLRDPRVRAAAPMAGPGCFFTKAYFDDTHVPLLMLHGSLDAIVPYQQNALPVFADANAPKYLVTIVGGTHTAFTGGTLFDHAKNADDVGCRGLSTNKSHDVDLVPLLGGAADGIVAGDCPLPCTDPTPRPTALNAAEQRRLTLLALLPFFQSTLRGDTAGQQFLEQTLAVENAATVQVQFVP